MEISLLDAAVKGLFNIFQFQVLLAMLAGVSIGTFTAVAPQGLGMPLSMQSCCPWLSSGSQ